MVFILRNRLFVFLVLLAEGVGSIAALSSVLPTSTRHGLFSSHVKSKTTTSQNNEMTLTYLEINTWLLSMQGVTVLIDPLLEGPLDFGIPDLYQGKKRVVPETGLTESLPPIDCILITQGLDDHANVRTLRKLRSLDPTVPILASPSAKRALKAAGFLDHEIASQVRFLYHGDETIIQPRTKLHNNNHAIQVRATQGALVGPPWQRRENGYVLRTHDGSKSTSSLSVYIEPHVEFNELELSRLAPVDVVITPISGQALPAFELVHGPKDAIRLLEILRPKYIVPMQNGDIDTQGPVSWLVSELGSPDDFKRLLATYKFNSAELVDVKPGVDTEISVT